MRTARGRRSVTATFQTTGGQSNVAANFQHPDVRCSPPDRAARSAAHLSEADMELPPLRYFVAIAEERNFTRAAERLWVAQPGLSTQIRRLEAELGVQLFDRHTRGVDLTDAGQLFLERARAALSAADAAGATGRDLEAGAVGTLRVGIATSTRCRRTSALLAQYARDRR